MQRLAQGVAGHGVVFAGFRQDVERWFFGFDVFVHAPRLEAFGLVLAEAMATALPVVATRVGGIPDIVRNGRTGILVEPDSPVALADALEQVVRDAALRCEMGTAGRRVALAEYTVELYARRHARLYRDLLAGRPPRGADEKAKVKRQKAKVRTGINEDGE